MLCAAARLVKALTVAISGRIIDAFPYIYYTPFRTVCRGFYPPEPTDAHPAVFCREAGGGDDLVVAVLKGVDRRLGLPPEGGVITRFREVRHVLLPPDRGFTAVHFLIPFVPGLRPAVDLIHRAVSHLLQFLPGVCEPAEAQKDRVATMPAVPFAEGTRERCMNLLEFPAAVLAALVRKVILGTEHAGVDPDAVRAQLTPHFHRDALVQVPHGVQDALPHGGVQAAGIAALAVHDARAVVAHPQAHLTDFPEVPADRGPIDSYP